MEEHPAAYQVDGEIGRFTFKTYDVKAKNRVVFSGISLFPVRTGRQWYTTAGFKELIVVYGAAQRSYRQTTNSFNRSRCQEEGGTPLNTLRDTTESEGLKVLGFLTRKAGCVFKAHKFSPEGVPEEDCEGLKGILQASRQRKDTLRPALTAVYADMDKKGLPTEDRAVVVKTIRQKAYENPEQCTYVHIDDVGVKEQKQHRKNEAACDEAPQDTDHDSRPTVQNTVAHIEQAGRGYTLTGRSVLEVLTFILAFLLNNGLLKFNIKFCTDGQRSLQNAVLGFFAWHKGVSLLLDWYHLVQKFKVELSLACRGRDIRNQHLKHLLTLLWFGLIDKAQAYLKAIPETDIKNQQAVGRLIGYLERNRQWIPCYAMRRKLRLPNSSSPAERCNNLVTAKRQKHQGMSWSENGSYALTALNAVVLNNAVRQWAENRTLNFLLPAKAA